MKRLIIGGLLALSALTASADNRTYLHVGGVSWHSSPGYNARNAGIGIEQELGNGNTVFAGYYRNSEHQHTTYVGGRILWPTKIGKVGIMGGLASGYERAPVAVIVAPTICWTYACVQAVPKIGSIETAVVAVQFRVPF